VKLTPQTQDDKSGADTVGRMSIDKQFHGDLEASSKGEMLAVGTAVKGSAGYVAMEQGDGNAQRSQWHLRASAYRHHDARHSTTQRYRGAGLWHGPISWSGR
jgi:hypothetical protein